ncbi:hypothetical protein [Nitrosopumilus sp.]|uniref:hypothetical protein n=1 Tax=Nitrosopumilus sp. TaxID=2024843 RepID=UPI00292E69C3|nr:hypothetical protein [Nitrosopumilus sp.]
MVPMIVLLIPDSITEFSPYGVLLSLYFLLGFPTYVYSRKIFKKISGKVRSKILIISFFILLGFHLFLGSSHYIYSSFESDEEEDDNFSKISDEIRQKIPNETRFEGLSDPEIFDILYTEHMCLEEGEFCERYRELLSISKR